jgi:hypothetical protein
MTFTFKNTAALAAVIDFVNNFRVLTNTLVGCEESAEQTLEFITSKKALMAQLLEIVGEENLFVTLPAETTLEPERYYTGDKNNRTGDVVSVFGWYGEQTWNKVMLEKKTSYGWRVIKLGENL